jgi:hypothetical protein
MAFEIHYRHDNAYYLTLFFKFKNNVANMYVINKKPRSFQQFQLVLQIWKVFNYLFID